ncbi:hypothetical protein [Nocardia terpenica]|uniref:Uncharacterized protein n=1 Tax=Nocardia terpenica TaxID=455432 RepID=A0A164HC69_9NOCA|nr:hypothetical protein [Nocardia terpenica]KZM68383.1 hypothetical protein AWN90_10880 [Nocardia terpenica]NQE88697.1 hypothetical protein [Nocardia terpenica]
MAEPQGDSGKPPQFTDQLAYWRSLKQQAEGGTFRLDPDLAQALRNRAETMRKHLEEDLLITARKLAHLDGFGTLPSSLALKQAFEQKADGAPDSAVNQYKAAIDIVTTMRDTYDTVIQKLLAQDHASAVAIGKTTEGA